MFGSLDFVYVPTADVDAVAEHYVNALGAELVWKVRGMGTTVACVRVGGRGVDTPPGPDILLSGHLTGTSPVLVYRVDDYASVVGQLRERGVTVHELEIPHGPCAGFTAEGGQRYAVYQLIRPEAVHLFDGRVDA
jgi:glyoxalase/bleomycin resistance protein/dioxygenase superfamily protein